MENIYIENEPEMENEFSERNESFVFVDSANLGNMIQNNSFKESDDLSQARFHQSECRFYSDYDQTYRNGRTTGFYNSTTGFYGTNGEYPIQLFNKVREILGNKEDKIKMYLLLFQNHYKPIGSKIRDELSKLFTSDDAVFNFEFSKPELEGNAEAYRATYLHDTKFFESNMPHILTASPNSILVVDMPNNPDPNDKYPKPYFHSVSIDNVLFIKVKKVYYNADYSYNVICGIIFKECEGDETYYYAFDEKYWRSFEKSNGENIKLLSESEHGLDYCPACFAYDDPLYYTDYGFMNGAERVAKRGVITDALSLIEDYVFHENGRAYSELYAKFPITEQMEQLCNYEEHGLQCTGGFLRGNAQINTFGGQAEAYVDKPCPNCSKRGTLWAGTVVQKPAPQDGSEKGMFDNAFRFIQMPVDSLNYLTARSHEYILEIEKTCIGTNMESVNNKAVNEKQVGALAQSRQSVFNSVARRVEKSWQFVLNTVFKLRYGNDFKGSTVYLGNEFFIYSESDLLRSYNELKASGASDYVLDKLSDQIIKTKFRNDSKLMHHEMILQKLKPFRHRTDTELSLLVEKGLVNADLAKYQILLPYLISQIESNNNTSIAQYGSKLDPNKQIQQIKNETQKLFVELNEKESDDNEEKAIKSAELQGKMQSRQAKMAESEIESDDDEIED